MGITTTEPQSASAASGEATAPGTRVPCRPYWPGEHAGAIRRRILVALGIGFVAAMFVPALLRATILVALYGPTDPIARMPPVVEAIDTVGFSVAFLVAAWAWVGPRRWGAIEVLVWGSRYAAAAYAAVTGIRNPADARAAAAWLQANPVADDEAPELTYWRAHAEFISRDLGRARATLDRLAGRDDYRYAVASLHAQMAMAEGRVPDLASVEHAIDLWTEPFGRALAAANLGALRAQYAWSCGGDDVAAALSVRPLMNRHASHFLLTRVWLPVTVLTLGISIGGAVLG